MAFVDNLSGFRRADKNHSAVTLAISLQEKIFGGTIYIKNQLGRFKDWGVYSVTDAVAAYNAGPGAVEKHGVVPNYSETVHYVIKVANNYKNLLKLIQS